jgi:hypothetical protein
MNHPKSQPDGFLSALPFLSRQSLGKRVKDMALLWALFGVVVGVATVPPGWGLIPVVAGVIAGPLVLTPLGVLLGLTGGHAWLALLGGVCGAALGGLLGLVVARGGALYVGSVGLIGGALAGATLSMTVSWAHFLARLLALPGRGRQPDPAA